MAGDIGELLADLEAETAALNAVVGDVDAGTLALPTPAAGWSVGDTMGHLWFFDREGRRALTDPTGFVVGMDDLLADPDRYLAEHLVTIRALGESVLPTWQEERRLIIEALASVDPASRVPWYGPPMSPMSFATARLMETWAHGQDVVDALGADRPATDRLRHIAHLGVRTRGFSYAIKGREVPDVPVFVALTGPSGDEWTWGEPDVANRVTGPALDFCLLVTQRRVLGDLSLDLTGAAARDWAAIAQAFAGGPTVTDQSRRGI